MKKGKQRELLSKEKAKRGLTWLQFADELDMKLGKLMTFFTGECLIDDLTFNKLILRKAYKNFIIKELQGYWGQSKGGNNSKGNLKPIRIPEKNAELAELWGIMLGDGCVHKIKKYKIGVYKITVSGHSIDDKDYLLNFVKPLLERLFNIKGRSYQSKSNRGLHIHLDSRRVIDFFEENDFKSGNKIVNQVTIPDWIKNEDKLLASCLRGLFDTDGSFYQLTNQNSYQINFCNNNQKLLKDVRQSLLKLGINVSRIMKNRRIVITRRSEIAKFYKLIGFSNPKHLNKIKKLF